MPLMGRSEREMWAARDRNTAEVVRWAHAGCGTDGRVVGVGARGSGGREDGRTKRERDRPERLESPREAMRRVIAAAAGVFGADLLDMERPESRLRFGRTGQAKTARVARYRMGLMAVAMVLRETRPELSGADIAEMLGGCTHSTVFTWVRRGRDMAARDAVFAREVRGVMERAKRRVESGEWRSDLDAAGSAEGEAA